MTTEELAELLDTTCQELNSRGDDVYAWVIDNDGFDLFWKGPHGDESQRFPLDYFVGFGDPYGMSEVLFQSVKSDAIAHY